MAMHNVRNGITGMFNDVARYVAMTSVALSSVAVTVPQKADAQIFANRQTTMQQGNRDARAIMDIMRDLNESVEAVFDVDSSLPFANNKDFQRRLDQLERQTMTYLIGQERQIYTRLERIQREKISKVNRSGQTVARGAERIFREVTNKRSPNGRKVARTAGEIFRTAEGVNAAGKVANAAIGMQDRSIMITLTNMGNRIDRAERSVFQLYKEFARRTGYDLDAHYKIQSSIHYNDAANDATLLQQYYEPLSREQKRSIDRMYTQHVRASEANGELAMGKGEFAKRKYDEQQAKQSRNNTSRLEF